MYSLSHRCLLLMQSFSVISANIVIKSYIAKKQIHEPHFCRRHYSSVFNQFDVSTPMATEVGKNNANLVEIRLQMSTVSYHSWSDK